MIPYTTVRRADTGVTNVTLGIWLFLASEVMLFGALFSAYALLRVSAPVWPRGSSLVSVPLGSLNTALLLITTIAVWRARDSARAAAFLWTATLAAAMFLGVKAFEYHGEFARGFVPATSTFAATYFTLTGLHALHVVAGVLATWWAIAGAARLDPAMTAGRVRALAWYWAFVEIVWLTIFVLVYLT